MVSAKFVGIQTAFIILMNIMAAARDKGYELELA
jgi:hypothetical protein